MYKHNERQPDSKAKRVLTRIEAFKRGTTYLQPSNNPTNQMPAICRLLPPTLPIGQCWGNGSGGARRKPLFADRKHNRSLQKEMFVNNFFDKYTFT